MSEKNTITVFEALLAKLQEKTDFNKEDEVAPIAILWPDEKERFITVADRFREALPVFLTLGGYNPETKTGPAVWIRAMVDRALPDADWDKNTIPVVYLPGASRKQLRNLENCPEELHPLVELQYRGNIWSQISHRDWTIAAFMQTELGGLGLDVASDQATLDALKQSLVLLADQRVEDLKGKRIDSDFLDNLIHPDKGKSILEWLNDPEGKQGSWSDDEWTAFCNLCNKEYRFDPQKDGELVAGEKLGNMEGKWEIVWDRFEESPYSFPNIKEVLRKSRPSTIPDGFFSTLQNWPQDNEDAESEVRKTLSNLDQGTTEKARSTIQHLEEGHSQRRNTVWAKLKETPLAEALRFLNVLAVNTSSSLPSNSLSELVNAYQKNGWITDAVALQALMCVKSTEDVDTVKTALRTVYLPWLQQHAEAFQQKIREIPYPFAHQDLRKPDHPKGTCILFVDGLRYDVGCLLRNRLSDSGANVSLSAELAALPTVTATAKYAISPIAHRLSAIGKPGDFMPAQSHQKSLTHHDFKKLLESDGYKVLAPDETGDPSGRAWTEIGELDHIGHEHDWKLAWRIDEELDAIVSRVQSLLKAGWKNIEMVTDHGWLLMPGGLPKADLPKYLTETKWRRCAELKPESKVEYQLLPWFWNPDVAIAYAPDIHMFVSGAEYSHGGLSLQECVVPKLSVVGTQDVSIAKIESAKWVRMTCKVAVSGASNHKLDIRLKAADSESSIAAEVVPVAEDGTVRIMVNDPDHEGSSAQLVLLGKDDQVVTKLATEVGG